MRIRCDVFAGIFISMMNGGARVQVALLDGHKLEFSVDPSILTQELNSLVASHYPLKESKYFSLAYKDNVERCHWLVEDWRLSDHDFARGVKVLEPLYFLIRFFPASISELKEWQTIDLFYQNACNIISKNELQVDQPTLLTLASYSIQASWGDFIDKDTTKALLKKLVLLPPSVFEENSSLEHWEDKICEHHLGLSGLSRIDSIHLFLKRIETVPGYGVHYFEVHDRAKLPWYLGISHKGIAQYDYTDRVKAKRIFLWKQLENLYLRERKFSIEVHDPKRVIHTLNSFNLYEGAIEDHSFHEDDLLKAISEDTTQVSVSRRTFGPGNVSTFIWFAETPLLCKAIWSMAIAQHQFYLDRKCPKSKEVHLMKDSIDFTGELSHSCLSLSTHSSPNLSRSGSHSSLQQSSHTESLSTESLNAAKMEMLAALQQRYQALQEKLVEKTEELKFLCIREGQLTGELPPEYPLQPGEAPPIVRKRVGTSFTLDENLIGKIRNKQEESVASLEIELEIQTKIASAALKLANDPSSKKSLRKQRKTTYLQAFKKLKEIEAKVQEAKNRQSLGLSNTSSTIPKAKKKPRPISDGIQDDTYLNMGPPTLSCQDGFKETSFLDSSPQLLPKGRDCMIQSSSQSSISLTKPKTSVHLQSPVSSTSPQKRPSHSLSSTSEISGGQTSFEENIRSGSPFKSNSGYIPSCVYAFSQYRTQHYPTLSTRGQPIPSNAFPPPYHQQMSKGPIQRSSLTSQSLDDLDSPLAHTQIPSNLKTPTSHLVHQHSAMHSAPQQYPFHHHHYNHHHPRRLKTDLHDRYGSLDRRLASSGRLESRSLEHLDAVPPNTPSTCHGNIVQPNNTMPSMSQVPLSPQGVEYTPTYGLEDGQMYPSSPSLANHSFESTISEFNLPDTVDSSASDHSRLSHTGRRYANCVSFDSGISTSIKSLSKLSRSTSTRSSSESMAENSCNQENIPSLEGSIHMPSHHQPSRGDVQATFHPPLARTSVDCGKPCHIPATDLPPLRATKSSAELPPLRPTNKLDLHVSTNDYHPKFQSPHLSYNHSFSTVSNSYSKTPSVANRKSIPCFMEEPMVSLAEASQIKRHMDMRSKSDQVDTSMPLDEKPPYNREPSNTDPHSPMALHNLSTSSIGSSGSSASAIFHSTQEGEPLKSPHNLSLRVESPNHMVITTGTFQPSREVIKPFEMSDFYKYSTKFRRPSTGHGDFPSSSESPLSPPNPRRHPSQSNNKSIANSKAFTPPSPSLIAKHSSPTPQQKGVYQPLTPLACLPLEEGSGDAAPEAHLSSGSSSHSIPQDASWESSPLHQAVPINVTTKRSATLV